MRISFTSHKNSKLATLISFLATICFIMAALGLFITITEKDVYLLLVTVIFAAIAVGLLFLESKVADRANRKVQEKANQSMRSDVQSQPETKQTMTYTSNTYAPNNQQVQFQQESVPHHFCGYCGTKLEPGIRFCTNCGKKIV